MDKLKNTGKKLHSKEKQKSGLISHLILILFIALSLIIIISFIWNNHLIEQQILFSAQLQAEISIKKDILYRKWNAKLNGIYAPITDKLKPNPYLDVKDKVIESVNRKHYTLINPAYMTRQVYDISGTKDNFIGHITSLKPINPNNKPDDFEFAGLMKFEKGIDSFHSVDTIKGKQYYRLIKPFYTEQSCLYCHEKQGYQVGDIRGGISISIPIEPIISNTKDQKIVLIVAHTLLLLMGYFGIYILAVRIRQNNQNLLLVNEREKKAAEMAGIIEMAGATSHEINQPLQTITMITDMVLEDLQNDNKNYKHVEQISLQTKRIGKITSKIQNISKSTTVSKKKYLKNELIVDIDSVENE